MHNEERPAGTKAQQSTNDDLTTSAPIATNPMLAAAFRPTRTMDTSINKINMKSKNEINKEAQEIYFAIKKVMEKTGYDYCQSWWLNTKNFDLKSNLKTPQIVQRCKLLVKQGYLIIDKLNTSRSAGTSYKLTDKQLIN